MEKQKALEMAISQIERQFGKGSIMRLGESENKADIPAISTGSLALDLALGVGGLPRGRIIEIFGPESSGKTTVALHAIAQAQQKGGVAAFIDAEHALDPGYARRLGVDVDNLLVSQPDTGEQALEIAEALVRSGAVDVIVIDSVAALVPRAEIEGEMGDAHVGLQARLMSQALRKLTGAVSKSRTCLIFINQIREKVGVLFGCLHASSPVRLADGSLQTIGTIVRRRLPVTVLSYDPAQGRIVPRRVVNWFDNGPTSKFLEIVAAYPGGRGRVRVRCTEDHPVLTPRGWRRARRLRVGDMVMAAVEHRLSDQQWEIARGTLLGSGGLRLGRGLARGVRLWWQARPNGSEYFDWKASFFGNIGQHVHTSPRGTRVFRTEPLPELYALWRQTYRNGRKHLDESFLRQLTPLSLAVWVCDQGSLLEQPVETPAYRVAVGQLSPDSRRRLAADLAERFGLTAELVESPSGRRAHLVFAGSSAMRLSELIAAHTPPCMAHLLQPQHRGHRQPVRPQFSEPTLRPLAVPVLQVREQAPGRSAHRFDIEVEGSHNYLADNIIVHNSPETTPGGRALKFYASVRIDVRRVEALKQGQDNVGMRVRAKIVKNKVAPPFRQAEFDLMYGTGIAREGDLLDLGIEYNIIQKAGAWYAYGDERLGQGRENAKAFLQEHPELAAEIEAKIREAAGLQARPATASTDEPEL
ncbi:MAG TPA: recombinase RecA [Bacillota bacterium]